MALGTSPAPAHFDFENRILTIRPYRNWVEITLSDQPGPIPPRAALLQTLSVAPAAPTGFRALVNPDSLERFLDSAQTTIASVLASKTFVRRPEATMGTPSTFLLGFARYSMPEFRVQGCGATILDTYVDTARKAALDSVLRQSIASARRARRRGERVAEGTIVCPPRVLAQSVIVPTLSRRDVGRARLSDETVDAAIDSLGRVTALRWHGRPPIAPLLDSAMRRWRFEPAVGLAGRRPSSVAMRVRYRTVDPLANVDSAVLLQTTAAASGAAYAVVGHVIDEHDTTTVASDDVRLHVDDGGRRIGIPIVLVGGGGTRISQFAPILERLRQERRVLTYDLRGHGQSTGAADYSLDAHVRDLLAVLDTEKLDRVVLGGAGIGGFVAAEVARRQPQRVAGLALLGPAGDYLIEASPPANVLDSIRREVTLSGRATALRRFFQPDDSLLLDWVVNDLRSTQREALLGTLDAAAGYDLAPAFAAYRGPKMILLTSGNKGPLRAPLAQAKDDVARTTYSRGRWLHLTNAAAVSAQFEAFVYQAEWANRR